MRPALCATATLTLLALAAGPTAAQTSGYGSSGSGSGGYGSGGYGSGSYNPGGYGSGGYRQPPAADADDDDAPPPPQGGSRRPAYGDDAGAQPRGYGASAPADQAGDSGADLVRQLNLRPDQQTAFHAYQAAFQSAQDEQPLDDPARLQGMTAPQRLDASAQQMERDRADFDRVSAATRRFYALLDPAQRRTFDRLTAPPLDDGQDEDGADPQRRPSALPPQR